MTGGHIAICFVCSAVPFRIDSGLNKSFALLVNCHNDSSTLFDLYGQSTLQARLYFDLDIGPSDNVSREVCSIGLIYCMLC